MLDKISPAPSDLAMLLGLSFFLGLAFEDYFARTHLRRPGGVRTFPLLALAGGTLYWLDPHSFIPFTAGSLIIGAWLSLYYIHHMREMDEHGEPNVGIFVPVLNFHAYILGALTLALPQWIAVSTTVCAVLLITGRERLHDVARRLEMKEIVTAGQFLVLTGIVLPLLPALPITELTSITPRQAWLALVVVCSLSYMSYLAQHYWPQAARGLWMPALGGLYSSTAMTVVLARQTTDNVIQQRRAQAGIMLATAIMYLRVLALVAVFNFTLAYSLALAMIGLSAFALLCSVLFYPHGQAKQTHGLGTQSDNPLEFNTALVFAILFVVTSVVSTWVTGHFGSQGVYTLAAIMGVTDIDPFVLNLAQGGAGGISTYALASAILIAASSNNLLKLGYAIGFGGWHVSKPSALVLFMLALFGFLAAWWLPLLQI
jgi:uncharacterized membrane protein (DUF4010 family)